MVMNKDFPRFFRFHAMMGTLLDTAMLCFTVQRQAGVVLFGHGICLHFDPPCRLQDVPW